MKRYILAFSLVFIFVERIHAQNEIEWNESNGPYGGYVEDMAFDAFTKTVYAVVNSRLFYSTDKGATWHKAAIPDNDNISDVEVDPAIAVFAISSSRLYSSQNGIDFSAVNPTSPFQGGVKFKIRADNANYLVLGFDNGANKGVIWRSSNNGVTWTKASGLLSTNSPVDFAVTSAGSIFVLENGGNLIERSNDNGGSWTQTITGITDANVASIAISPDRSTIYCVANGNIYETTTGAFWSNIKFDIPDLFIGWGSFSRSFLSFDGSVMHFVDNANNKLYRKNISDTFWELIEVGFITTSGFSDVETRAMVTDELSHLYFGTGGLGVHKSTNGGTVLSEANAGLAGNQLQRIVVANNGNIIVAGSGLYLSTDNGQSWSRKSVTNSLQSYFDVFKVSTGINSGRLLAFGGGLAFSSDDHGSVWDPMPVPPGYLFATLDGVNIYSWDGTNIYFSNDGAASWSSGMIPSGMPANFSFDRMVVDNGNRLFVKVNDNAINDRRLYKILLNNYTAPTTATGSLLNISSTSITTFSDLDYMDNQIFILGHGASNTRLAFSADQGATWTTKTCPSAFKMDADNANKYLLLTGSNGDSFQINVSKDNGNTFDVSTLTTNTQSYYSGTIIGSDNFAYALVNQAGVFRSKKIVVTPPTPLNLINAGVTDTGLTLRFEDNSLNEDGFIVQREVNGVFKALGEQDSLSDRDQSGKRLYYRIRGLQPGTTYNFRVCAYNDAGNSSFLPITVSTLAQTAPSIPDNRSWTGTTANIDGLASAGTNLNVGIKHIGNGKYFINDVSAGILNTITGHVKVPGQFYETSGQTYLSPNEDFHVVEDQNGTWNGSNQLTLFWRLDKDRQAGYPDKYEKITLTLNGADPIPDVPTNVNAYVYSSTGIEVSWVGNLFEKEFIIERSTSSTGTFAEVGRVNYPATRFIDNGTSQPLALNNTYFYRVKASNLAGVSAESAVSPGVIFTLPNFVLTNSAVSNSSPGTSSGSIWADFDNDGDEDLLITQLTLFSGTTTTPYGFRNDGNGSFTSVSTGIEASKYLTSIAADFDNDGNTDVFLMTTAEANLLYRGNGNFTFTKVEPNSVGENSSNSERATITAGWVDFDKNGKLDLFVGKQSGLNLLFAQSSTGTFVKNTTEELVNYVGQNNAHSWVDYDNDNDMDLYISDRAVGSGSPPPVPNRLYKNNGDGTFTRVTGLAFDSDLNINGITTSWGDYDNDGDLDLFVGSQQETTPNFLYRNNGAATNFTFTKITSTPISEAKTGDTQTFGSAWGDIDNDGNLDLVVTQLGHNVIYKNNGSGGFTKVTNEKFNDATNTNFGISLADYDKDGFLDVAAASINPTLFSEEGNSDEGPSVNSQLYKNNNTSGSTRNWIQIKLIGTVSNRSAIGARITVTAGSKTQIREISTPSGFASGGSLITHVGLGAATTASTIQVRWPSGIVQTFSNEAANRIITITEDGAGPAITSRTPAPAATAVPLATTFSITHDESSTAVAGKKLNVFLASNQSTPAFSFDVTSAAKTDKTYTFTLPGSQTLQPNAEYVITLDAGAFKDQFGNESAAVASGTWTFKTVDPPDVTAPVITFTPVANPLKGFGSVSPSITVTDNKQVSTVVVSIRAITGTTYAPINATAGATANTWTATLSEATHFDAIGTEFFITATDAAGNTTRNPEGTATHKVFLTYNENESKIPSDRLGFGGQKANWKVFAIPFELGTNNAVTSVFNEFEGLTNKVDYRLITYGSETAWSEYPTGFTTIARGTGYFINIKEPVEIKIGNSLTAPQNSRSNLFQISLKQGWNMVGNPYLTSISWADVAAYNSLTGTTAQLKKFLNGQYSNNQSLSSYEGGFVFASAATTVSIPFLGQTTAGGRDGFRNLDTNIDAEEWALPLTLTQGDLKYELGSLGMAQDASMSFDTHDDITPPRFFDYLEMNFSHPEHFAKRFTRDVVPTQSAYTWAFTADASLPGQAQLSWDNMALSAAQNDIFLLDVARQKLVNMKETGGYFFDPKESTNFKVYFGNNLKIAPQNVHLGKAYPNPTSGLTTVAFSLPESGGLTQQVSLDIMDAMGKAVGTISQGGYAPGYHEVNWDAKTLSNGFYTYRLTVNGKQGKTTQISKLIIK